MEQRVLPSRRKTELVAAHVDPATRDRLVDLAVREDRSLAAIVRRALGRELERSAHEEGER